MNSTGPIGWFLNGVPLHGYNDGLSYNGFDVWQNLAVEFLKFDLDVCNGHSTNDYPYHRKYTFEVAFLLLTRLFRLQSLSMLGSKAWRCGPRT